MFIVDPHSSDRNARSDPTVMESLRSLVSGSRIQRNIECDPDKKHDTTPKSSILVKHRRLPPLGSYLKRIFGSMGR